MKNRNKVIFIILICIFILIAIIIHQVIILKNSTNNIEQETGEDVVEKINDIQNNNNEENRELEHSFEILATNDKNVIDAVNRSLDDILKYYKNSNSIALLNILDKNYIESQKVNRYSSMRKFSYLFQAKSIKVKKLYTSELYGKSFFVVDCEVEYERKKDDNVIIGMIVDLYYNGYYIVPEEYLSYYGIELKDNILIATQIDKLIQNTMFDIPKNSFNEYVQTATY